MVNTGWSNNFDPNCQFWPKLSILSILVKNVNLNQEKNILKNSIQNLLGHPVLLNKQFLDVVFPLSLRNTAVVKATENYRRSWRKKGRRTQKEASLQTKYDRKQTIWLSVVVERAKRAKPLSTLAEMSRLIFQIFRQFKNSPKLTIFLAFLMNFCQLKM